MEFAGNNFVYISQKKKTKVKEIQQGNKDAPPKIEELPAHLEESQKIDSIEDIKPEIKSKKKRNL